MWLTALGGNLLTVGGTSDPQGAISNSTGNVTISDNLVVTSISDLQSTISNSTRNVTIGDNLTVTGATPTKRRTWPPQLPPPFRRQTRLRSLASLSPICVTGISTFRRSLPGRQSPANHHRSHERMSYGWRDFFPPSPCRSNFGYSPCNVSCGSGQRRKTRIATIYTGRIDLDRRRPGASSLMRKLKLSCV